MIRKLSLEQFIKRSSIIHKNKYDYSKTNYVRNSEKVIIICPIHGCFEQVASEHLRGRGCVNCRGLTPLPQFIEKAKKVHNNKYVYDKVEYKNSKIKVIIICKKHGEFAQTPNVHLCGGGCPTCANNVPCEIEFIEKARKIHNNKYDYSKVNYINSKSKVEIICPIHGSFFQISSNHVHGCGCQKCMADSYRMSLEQFIEKSNKIHKNKYDYSKTNYVRNKEKVIIICPKHGEFVQPPVDHLNGHGCLKCGFESSAEKRKSTTKEFIEKSNRKHKNKYDYDKVEYINRSTKIEIICRKHGSFFQNPFDHLAGCGCPSCGNESVSKKKKSNTEEFIKRAKKVHKNKYDYEKTIYVSSVEKLTIICKKHGKFLQFPCEHIRGHGCPRCRQFKRVSKKSQAWLDMMNVPEENREYIIKIKNRRFVVDGFMDGTVYEFNGDFWHGNPEKFNSNDINPITKTTFGKLYKETINRNKLLKEAGYKIISIWETDFEL